MAANETCPASGEERWWVYLATFSVIYFVGLSTSSATFGLQWLLVKRLKKFNSNTKILRYYAILQDFVRHMISGDTLPSKILISVTLVCNLVYMGLAVARSFPPQSVEECFEFASTPSLIVELVVVIELLLFSLLRFLATNNKVLYWFSLYTIVDVVTLPHIFISLALGVDWIGLRSLRFVWLTQIVTIVQFIPYLVISQDTIDVLNLGFYVIILWLTCSGVIHLLESQGDPWKSFDNRVGKQSVLYYIYFIMVTMSTVGYGDISPETDLGRGFMTFFIIGGLAFFAALLPKLVDVVSNYYAKTQYAKFDTTRVPRHVIVCGHITAVTAEDFLKDFLHPDRGDKHTHILFLHPEKPDQDLKNVLRSYYTRVQFLLGSVMNSRDLQRAKMLCSDAIFILANKHTDHPSQEDSANLLRLVSVKNTTSDVTVIIQLLHSFSKKQVYNIEGWKVGRDIAVCLNELKLGLLAQSCLCPGFSTMIANLFYTSDFSSDPDNGEWKDNYIKGASNEIYSSTFSPDFNGMTFHEAAKICYDELNVILLAVGLIVQKKHEHYVNPSPQSHPYFKIYSKAVVGYFIAQDKKHVSGVSTFCNCESEHEHESMKHGEKMLLALSRKFTVNRFLSHSEIEETVSNGGDAIITVDHPQSKETNLTDNVNKSNGNSGRCEIVPADESIQGNSSTDIDYDSDISDGEITLDRKFHQYVSEPNLLEKSILSPYYLVRGESSLNSSQPDIRNHIVLCIFADDDSPLLGLHNFLKPLRYKHLADEDIKPVVIVSDRAFIEKEWTVIRSIPKVYVVAGSPLRWENLRAARVMDCSVCVILSVLASTGGHEHAIDDKEAILCSLSIQKKLKKKGKKGIQVITDLRQESNVQFLDFGDEDEPDERIYKAQPFACGEAFSVSMFDSITTSAFHGPGIMYLVETLIHASGTNSPCQVVPTSIKDTGYAKRCFKDFHNDQLEKFNVCLGLFRRLPLGSGEQRYIITLPDPDLILKEDDIAFILTELGTL